MNKKHNPELITTIITGYNQGHPVTLLSAEHNIPRSTIYFWLKRHQKLKSTTRTDISYQDYHNLKRRANKLEERLEIIKTAACSLSAPLQEKLEALEKLYGQYSIHALCDALEVPRGTFYNHVLRRKRVTYHDLRREELREQVKIIFDENKQRFGSRKICAILAERGISTSPNYVAGLMQEMNSESIGRHSKSEHRKRGGRTRRQNMLQQQFNVVEPNRVWVSDTT